MLFWLTVLALTIAAVVIGFRPMLRPAGATAPDRAEDLEHDTAVYRHQLEELDSEEARGAISSTEAAQARNEIARRLLAVEDRKLAVQTPDGERARRGGLAVLSLFALVFVPGLTLIIYGGIGQPGYEAQPLAARLEEVRESQAIATETQAQLRELVARAEDHLRTSPEDGRGWDVLAPVYFRLGEVGKAQTAYRNAINLLGETPTRLAGLGEVMVTAAGGIVTEDASVIFDQVLDADPANARARFFTGLGAVQLGQNEQAVTAWTALATDADADPAWRAVARQSLERLSQAAAPAATPAEAPGRPPALDEDTVQQMSNLNADERSAVIEDMVASLDARLQAEPDDLEGWKRLIRARIVLDQPESLRDALQRAYDVYQDRPADLDSLKTFAAGLGLNVEDYWP